MSTLVEKFFRGEETAWRVERERYIAEGVSDSEPWLVMAPDGTVSEYRDRRSALKAINAKARKSIRPGSMLITEIEWRFQPSSSNKVLDQSARPGV